MSSWDYWLGGIRVSGLGKVKVAEWVPAREIVRVVCFGARVSRSRISLEPAPDHDPGRFRDDGIEKKGRFRVSVFGFPEIQSRWIAGPAWDEG